MSGSVLSIDMGHSNQSIRIALTDSSANVFRGRKGNMKMKIKLLVLVAASCLLTGCASGQAAGEPTVEAVTLLAATHLRDNLQRKKQHHQRRLKEGSPKDFDGTDREQIIRQTNAEILKLEEEHPQTKHS